MLQSKPIPPSGTAEIVQHTDVVRRSAFSARTIRSTTQMASVIGVQAATNHYHNNHPNEALHRCTVSKWLNYRIKTRQYYRQRRRGRPPGLQKAESITVRRAVTVIRSEPNCLIVTARLVSAIARGVVTHMRPGVLRTNGGQLCLGKRWATYQLHRWEWKPFARTSNRTVSPETIMASAGLFFKCLRETNAHVSLTVNLDEFAVCLGPNQKWTWQPLSRRKSVAVRPVRAGFACTVVTTAAGRLLELHK